MDWIFEGLCERHKAWSCSVIFLKLSLCSWIISYFLGVFGDLFRLLVYLKIYFLWFLRLSNRDYVVGLYIFLTCMHFFMFILFLLVKTKFHFLNCYFVPPAKADSRCLVDIRMFWMGIFSGDLFWLLDCLKIYFLWLLSLTWVSGSF